TACSLNSSRRRAPDRRGSNASNRRCAAWRHLYLSEKAEHRVGELRRPLDRRQVPAALDHVEPRAGNALAVALAVHERYEAVLSAPEDERRGRDTAESSSSFGSCR